MRVRSTIGRIAAASVVAGCASPTASPARERPIPVVATGVTSTGEVKTFTAGNLNFAVPRSWPDGIAMARSLSRHLGPPRKPQGGELASQAASGYGLSLSRKDGLAAGPTDGMAIQLPAKLLDSSDMGWPAGAWAAEAQASNGVVPVVLTVVAPDKATAEAVAGSFHKAGG